MERLREKWWKGYKNDYGESYKGKDKVIGKMMGKIKVSETYITRL